MTFNPNEPRDEKGKWVAGNGNLGGSHPSGPFMYLHDAGNVDRADKIASIAADTAKQLGFDPTLINVTDESRTFELNGKTLNYAGAAHLTGPQGENTVRPKGTITLYTPHAGPESAIPGLTAHEVQHQKFQAFLNDYKDERERMEKDPDYEATKPKWSAPDADGTIHKLTPGSDDFMRPDGTLKEPYDKRYPVYSAWQDAMATSTQDFAKTDGVSGYSRDWWDAWHAGKANTDQAMHETLAEIARVKLETFKPAAERKAALAEYTAAHEKNIAEIKALGGQWTDEDEKEWKKTAANANRADRVTHMMRKKDGLMKLKPGLDPKWNKLYKAVEDNWKRRGGS